MEFLYSISSRFGYTLLLFFRVNTNQTIPHKITGLGYTYLSTTFVFDNIEIQFEAECHS